MIGEPKFTSENVQNNGSQKSSSSERQENFLYHKVPEDVRGSEIVSLNVLKERDEELHQKEVVKYEGRKELMQINIEPLDCSWADVIFLAAVHPQEIHRELREAGFGGIQGRYYKIPISNLEHGKLALIMPEQLHTADKNILPFSHDLLDPHFSEAMREYLKEQKMKGELPFVHAHLQQAIYKGEIPIKDLEIIDIE
jgi:hypothetical protein